MTAAGTLVGVFAILGSLLIFIIGLILAAFALGGIQGDVKQNRQQPGEPGPGTDDETTGETVTDED